MEPIRDLEMDYRVLSTLEDNPLISQRQMARQLDVSLGNLTSTTCRIVRYRLWVW